MKEYHIGIEKGEIGKYVILPGDPGRVAKIASYFDDAKEIAFNREFRTFTGTVDSIKISATSTGIGCPSTAIAIEELVKCGAEIFIRVGTAGSLQEEVKVGDLAISTAAVREEGTTRQYVPIEYPAVADIDVTWALREAAKRIGITAHTGISHCKDAFYTEGDTDIPLKEFHKARWNTWYRSNVISTSMESSALFVISSIKKVRAGEVLAIIGRTYSNEPIVKKTGIEEAIKVAIEAVKILNKELNI